MSPVSDELNAKLLEVAEQLSLLGSQFTMNFDFGKVEFKFTKKYDE